MNLKPFSFALAAFTFFQFTQVQFSFADNQAPECLDSGNRIPVDNEQVIEWKKSTKNQYQARGHIAGTITKVYKDQSGHDHFQITIAATTNDNSSAKDTIEVIYNNEFGALPDLKVQMNVETCGDYITSNKATGRYKASPDGAIIHWVHKSNDEGKHESGYVMIDGRTYGH